MADERSRAGASDGAGASASAGAGGGVVEVAHAAAQGTRASDTGPAASAAAVDPTRTSDGGNGAGSNVSIDISSDDGGLSSSSSDEAPVADASTDLTQVFGTRDPNRPNFDVEVRRGRVAHALASGHACGSRVALVGTRAAAVPVTRVR